MDIRIMEAAQFLPSAALFAAAALNMWISKRTTREERSVCRLNAAVFAAAGVLSVLDTLFRVYL